MTDIQDMGMQESQSTVSYELQKYTYCYYKSYINDLFLTTCPFFPHIVELLI